MASKGRLITTYLFGDEKALQLLLLFVSGRVLGGSSQFVMVSNPMYKPFTVGHLEVVPQADT